MARNISNRVDSWNRLYKARSSTRYGVPFPSNAASCEAAKICREAEIIVDMGLDEPKKTFSRRVCEWNQHYQGGTNSVPIEVNTSADVPIEGNTSTDDDCLRLKEEEKNNDDDKETEQISIAQKVDEWNRHYKSTKRQTRGQTDRCRLNDTSTKVDAADQVAERVNMWEGFYRPRRKPKQEDEKSAQHTNESKTRQTNLSKPRIAELVGHWNQCNALRGKSQSINALDNASEQKNSHHRTKNTGTSQLVQHWNVHYTVRGPSDGGAAEPSMTTTVVNTGSNTSSSTNSSNQPIETKKPARSKVSRKPSIVKARIEKLVTEAAKSTDTTPRCRSKPQQTMEIGRYTCRSNFAEMRSKFALSCYNQQVR